MNLLFLGLGSIGQRHLRNLKIIKNNLNIYAIRSNRDPQKRTPTLNNKNVPIKKDLVKKYNIKLIKSFSDLKKNNIKIDAAFICTPSSLHAKQASLFIKNKISVFIEKPVGVSYKDFVLLKKTININSKVKNMVGFQSKFNPIIIYLKKLIRNIGFENIYHVLFNNVENVSDFHPYENYRYSYAVTKKLGGGAILTQKIHELDCIQFLFNDCNIKYYSSYNSKVSDLKIDCEDISVSNLVLSKNKKKVLCNLNVNLFEKYKNRTIKIVHAGGEILVDLVKNEILIKNKKKIKKIKFKFTRNDVFLKELRYFISRVLSNQKIDNCYNINYALKSLKLALQIKKII
jgi:predicted dehydrogenase